MGLAALASGIGAISSSAEPVTRIPDRRPADTDSDLARIAGRAQDAAGKILYLTGQVRDAAGREVADARIEIWHRDAQGRDPFAAEDADENFQGYGIAESGADGSYRFRTVRPGASENSAPYVAMRISAPGFGAITTRVALVSANENALGPVAVLTPASDAEPGALAARFDIVLNYNASAPA